MTSLAASVVVPTRDRPGQLAECLAALAAQTVTPAEVIVVDDASVRRDRVCDVVSAAGLGRLVDGQGDGPAAARNLGASAVTSPICCLLDDDCRPRPTWIEALVGRIAAGAAVVAGATRNGEPGNAYATASQTIIDHVTLAGHDPATGTTAFAPSCNLGVATETLRAVPFDERYPSAAGEDRDWCSRLGVRGIDIAFEPTAIVDHHQRLSAVGFWRQQVRYGRGARRWQLERSHGDRLQARSFYVDLVRRGFDGGVRVGALVLVAQLATAVGIASEAAACGLTSAAVEG